MKFKVGDKVTLCDDDCEASNHFVYKILKIIEEEKLVELDCDKIITFDELNQCRLFGLICECDNLKSLGELMCWECHKKLRKSKRV